MSSLHELVGSGSPIAACRPFPRSIVDEAGWTRAIDQLADGRLTLSGLWGETTAVHMALLEEATGGFAVLTLPCPTGAYPCLSARHPPAIRLERAIRDLSGHEATLAPDSRPWLDHGRWSEDAAPQAYEFLPSEGEGLHQIPVGPVHAGIIEPGHFRFTASGETVVRLEARLGYAHKGVASLMAGADIDRALTIAERISGDSSLAYAFAFCRAVEAALGVDAPPRAAGLRGIAAELERIANHLGDFGAISNDASFTLLHAHCGVLREKTLRAAETAFGGRFLRGFIVPGGVARDLAPEGYDAITALIADIKQDLPALIEAYDETSSLQDRTVTTGRLDPALARRFGAGGFVGRASGRAFDARKDLPYPPYDRLDFKPPVLKEGDVDARVRIRHREIEASLAMIARLLAEPAGEIRADTPRGASEGIALVEGFRGDILCFARLSADGRVASCHLRDPSWFQWPLLEAAIEGNIVADFPLCNKSFNCSYSGHDL